MKTKFLGSIFKSKGKIFCQLIEKDTGTVFYVIAPTLDTKKNPVKVGYKYRVTMSKNKRFFFKKIEETKINQKQIDNILEHIEKMFSQKNKKEVG